MSGKQGGLPPESNDPRSKQPAFGPPLRKMDIHQANESLFWESQIRAARWLNWITAASAVVGLIGLLFIGISLQFTRQAAEDGRIAAESARRQAIAAIAANDASLDALHKSQRPWIVDASVKLIKPIEFTTPRDADSHYTFFVKVTLKNTGTSIAKDVFLWLALEKNLATTLNTYWDRACIELKKQRNVINKSENWPLGYVIAPGEEISVDFSIGGPVREHQDSPNVGEVVVGNMFLLTGCVQYIDQFNEFHYTRFAYQYDNDIQPWDNQSLRRAQAANSAD